MITSRIGGTCALRQYAASVLLIALALYLCFPANALTRSAAYAQASRDAAVDIFINTPEEEVTPTRWEIGNTIISNEDRLELFKDSVADIGGGYVGLGGTQNFLLASWANSEWIWLFDFTRRVVTANRIHVAFLKNAATPAEFRSLWTRKSKGKAMEIIDSEFSKDPDIGYVKKTWNIGLGYIPWRFNNLDRVTKKYRYRIWLNDQAYYDRLRNLAVRDHIIARKGNLNGTLTIAGIADSAKKMGVPVRIIYLSNAEEYIQSYSDQFKSNFTALPADDKSVLLRTTSVFRGVFPWAPDSEISTDKGFHYNVMPVKIFQEWLALPAKKLRVTDMMRPGAIDMKNGFSIANKKPQNDKTQPSVKK
jgi:hypothetical protein